jgi:hypothetical protein
MGTDAGLNLVTTSTMRNAAKLDPSLTHLG